MNNNRSPTEFWKSCDVSSIRMNKNAEVLTCVDTIASIIGTMTMFLMENGDSGHKRIHNSLADKIDINPNINMTRYNFYYKIIQTMYLEGGGNCVVVPTYNNDSSTSYIESLEFLDMDRISYRYNDRKYWIVYKGRIINPEEVLHFVLKPSFESAFIGMGYENALKDYIKSIAQETKTKQDFQNSNWKPSVVVSIDGLTADMASEDGREKIEEKYLSNTNAGKPWIIPAGLVDVKEIKPLTLKDLALEETITLDKRGVASVLGVPSFLVGVGDFKKDEYNNFIGSKILSLCKNIQEEMTRKILLNKNWYFKFNIRSKYQYDVQETMAFSKDMVQLGSMTRNEQRNLLGYDGIEGGDEIIMLENYIPVDQLGNQKKLN